jgi:hypothetical protein
MMKVYLAAQFARQAELRIHREELEAVGVPVTSTWLDEQHIDNDTEKYRRNAEKDLWDIEMSDALVLFTGHPYHGSVDEIARGGRHVETGFALAKGLEVIICGPLENIFHYTHFCTVLPDWARTIKYIMENK